MPCNSIAVVQAKISPDVAAEILGSEKAIEGLRRYIEQQTGRPATVARYGAHGCAIRAGSVDVNIGPGNLSVSGSRWTEPGPGVTLEALTERIEARAQRMAVALATERSVGLLRSRYVVKADQTLPNGARVMRLSV